MRENARNALSAMLYRLIFRAEVLRADALASSTMGLGEERRSIRWRIATGDPGSRPAQSQEETQPCQTPRRSSSGTPSVSLKSSASGS
jgi:hypothetical protein